MRIYAAIYAGGGAVQVFEQLLAGEGLARAAGKDEKQFEFVGSEFDGHAIERDGIFFRVNFEAANANDGWRFDLAFGTAKHGTHAGNEHSWRKRFGDVIIRADLKASDLIHFFGEGGEHDDGNVAFAAQNFADFAPVNVGEHQVKDDEIWFFAAGSCQRGLTVSCGEDAIAVLFQIITRKAGDRGFIINNED